MHAEPEVRTTTGAVRGIREGPVAVFRGIPYAEPPFGPRRFAAPAPARLRDGVLDAREFGPPVPQASAPPPPTGEGNDCLTLNIWSPALGATGLPVMAWIHGGAYLEGTSGNPHYDGATLAGAGVVVVSMNYRVGVEGFARIDGAPDNRGILDQAAALRWIQENVAAFGGDPDNVTVFGQSAGAGCIAALLVMPAAAGLFRRAIAQSLLGTYFSLELATEISTTIAAELGARPILDELTDIVPHALIDATSAVVRRMPGLVDSWGPMALTPTPFSPVVDGEVLRHSPWRALADGAARGTDLLVGHTRDEYRHFTAHRPGEVTEEQLAVALEHLAPASDRGDIYPATYPDATAADLYDIVNSDWLFRMPSLHLAHARHIGGGRAWTYELCWGYKPEEGAPHCLDFLLVFGTLGTDEVRDHPSADPNAADELDRVAHHIRTDWVRFAGTGDPGWARYDPHTRSTRVYTAEPSTRSYPEERSRRIWHAHRFDTLNLRSP